VNIERNSSLLTVKKAAEHLSVSPGCIYTLISKRKLPHVRIGVGRGTIRIRESDLEAYVTGGLVEIEEHKVATPRARLKHLRVS
jgi:excisionase family DNA binding protein